MRAILGLLALGLGIAACAVSEGEGAGAGSSVSKGLTCPRDVPVPEGIANGATDGAILASPVFRDVLYGNLNGVAPSGAFGVNAAWERGESSTWYVEEQKRGADAFIGGVLTDDAAAIDAGFRMMEWGFANQAADGSFQGTADNFHSTAIFVASVAHAAAYALAAPQAEAHRPRIQMMLPKLRAAARWMTGPIWQTGLERNARYTHRRYIVALALALTSKLTNDATLMESAASQVRDGLSLQDCGINPELGGHDSSYQAVGLWYASVLLANLPDAPFARDLWTMIQRGIAWEASRIDSCGKVSTEGNTRTGPNTTDVGRSGVSKDVDYNKVIRALAYWHHLSQDPASTWMDRATTVAWYRGWSQKGTPREGCASAYWR